MTLAIHLILITLATLSGWDTLRRLLPIGLPGVAARVVIAGLAVVLWMFCPIPILVGMSVVGVLMMIGPYISVEPHWEWGKSLRDYLLGCKQQAGQPKVTRRVVAKENRIGKSFKVRDQVGKRITKL